MTAQLSSIPPKNLAKTAPENRTYLIHQTYYYLNKKGELIEYSYVRTQKYKLKKPLIKDYFSHSEEEEKLCQIYKSDILTLARQLTSLLNKNNPDKPKLTEKQVKDYLYRNKGKL